MSSLTLQRFYDSQWHDIAILDFTNPELGRSGSSEISYLQHYAINFLDQTGEEAASINFPVMLWAQTEKNWLCFLDDIAPSGASRRYWIRKLGIGNLTPQEQDFHLLKAGTIAPIGHLRIKESVPAFIHNNIIPYFTKNDVANRNIDFLEYAQQRGAAAGGATGAGGEAPKLLLRCSDDERIWIDTFQNTQSHDLHYLVKFPRGSRTPIDSDILRTEFHYYQELASLGFNTIPIKHMLLIEGDDYPSLWLPRFDVFKDSNNQWKRHAVESIYSILSLPPATILDHFDVIARLLNKIHSQLKLTHSEKAIFNENFVKEYVARDLLNIVFGNSDNHGRNTAFFRTNNQIIFTPIYDFAPMKADPEGITRTFQWGNNCELGGEYDFTRIADNLDVYVQRDILLSHLRDITSKLTDLPQRLAARGVPDSILTFPSIGFDYLIEKLTRWGLLND